MSPTFWVEDFYSLFHNSQILPNIHESMEINLNCITRILIIGLLFTYLFFDHFPHIIFLVLITFIIFIYYFFRSRTVKEPYGDVPAVTEPVPKVPWCSPTNDFVFSDQQDNPRTRCGPPNVSSRSPLFLSEKASNPQLVDSGQTSTYCYDELHPLSETVGNNERLVGRPNPKTLVQPVIPSPIYDFEVWQPNDFVIPNAINDQRRQELFQNGYMPVHRQQETRENYEDMSCGYQPINLEYQLPVNYPASPCQKQPAMREYNNNLFTVPLQPNLYTKSQVNQNDASMYNLGISQTTPFYPTTFQNQTFVEHDPAFAPPCKKRPIPQDLPFRNEIYDPRLTGYGSSDRAYIDPMNGQPRFFYDDIDQQTQSKYLTRNNIDFADFGTTVGFNWDQSLQGDRLYNHADQTYTDSQIGFRSQLQQRLMSKNSHREWQQRIAPISTQNYARASSGTSSSASYSGPRGG